MTIKQAAERLGVHPSLVRTWVREKRIKATKVGYMHWITPSALAAFEKRDRPRGRPKKVLTVRQ